MVLFRAANKNKDHETTTMESVKIAKDLESYLPPEIFELIYKALKTEAERKIS